MIICLTQRWLRTIPWIVFFLFGLLALSIGIWMAVRGMVESKQSSVKWLSVVAMVMAAVILAYPALLRIIYDIQKANRLKALSIIFLLLYSWGMLGVSIYVLVGTSSREQYDKLQEEVRAFGITYLIMGLVLCGVSAVPIVQTIRAQF